MNSVQKNKKELPPIGLEPAYTDRRRRAIRLPTVRFSAVRACQTACFSAVPLYLCSAHEKKTIILFKKSNDYFSKENSCHKFLCLRLSQRKVA
ncbi:hypothetical protein B9Z55_021046 [Caenorhabditis nigoni]|uniref:Uncharacterized protein n=1 Tax=Caenorhabditis nigoni TaxID=1611254 RepID=A0A2G5TQB4_9PELO|nr:hypothetical protein B9Z55_021046 [Caenorhabditis nigoni]